MPQKLKNYYHLFVAVLANVIYGFPSRKLTVVGVTGTDGKTTTSSLIYHILDEAGKKTALISTVGAFIGGKQYELPFHVTTPSSFGLQKYIKKAADSGCKYLVLEITSHGLDQYRDWGVNYKIGVITNITHEHLDYHKTYQRYVKTKAKLLAKSDVRIVNRDDESFTRIMNNELRIKFKKLVTFGLTKDSDINPKDFPFETKLIGEFNKYNCLAAIGVCRELGLDKSEIQKGISSFIPPHGRQDIVYDKDFKVMIDFAHTPNSFLQILPALKKQTKGKLIHVFGAAGLRDKTKRPLMGKASSQSADIIILTSEDPRTEFVDDINKDIKKGITNKVEIQEIPDRHDAIKFAINHAKKGDMVIITGKGHEKSMNMGEGEEPWDESEAVKEALENKYE